MFGSVVESRECFFGRIHAMPPFRRASPVGFGISPMAGWKLFFKETPKGWSAWSPGAIRVAPEVEWTQCRCGKNPFRRNVRLLRFVIECLEVTLSSGIAQ
jgi:hypothetical protein